MLNIETCRKILNDGGYELEISNEEIKDLRDFLYRIRMEIVCFIPSSGPSDHLPPEEGLGKSWQKEQKVDISAYFEYNSLV